MLTIFLIFEKRHSPSTKCESYLAEFNYNINLELLQSVSNKFICKFVSCLSYFLKDKKNIAKENSM